MKKLTILVVIMLVAGLLAGCWLFPGSKLDKIEVEPVEVTLNIKSLTGITQQLEVIAYYDDKTSADVTPGCDYNSSLSNTTGLEIVTVSDEGLIVAIKPKPEGALDEEEATILITYTQHNLWTGRIIRTCEVEVTVEY